MKVWKNTQRCLAFLIALIMVVGLMPISAFAASDATLTASLNKAKAYIDGITINNTSNDPATVVQNFKTHFTWDNEKRENSKSYLFDWSYYNGVVFEGIEYVYEITGESVYKDYVLEYMSSMITSSGGWANCTNNSSKQAAGYNSTHGADCYKTASLLMDCYEMTGDNRYLTMAKTLYADLDSAATKYSLKNAGNNYRHTWSSDPSPDLWLDGLYMILPFRAEYAKHIGDTEELNLIVSRMQWVSDNMYNSSKKLFYHAADNASSNSGTYWLRSIGWYAAAIVDIMDSMEGSNLEAMKVQLKKLVDGMKACQNSSNGMWLNNMNASQSTSNPYETSGTALTCYAVMKAVNNGWLDESYADMAILAFNGICNEKLSGSNLKDICFKGAPGSSNSTFYDNEGKGVGPFIMFYAEVLEYVNKSHVEPEVPETTAPEATEPEVTEPSEPEATEPEPPTPSIPDQGQGAYTVKGNLAGDVVYTKDTDGINSGEKYLIVYSGKALENNNGEDNNPAVTISNDKITLADDSKLAWTITQKSGSDYYVENNGSYLNLTASGTDPIGNIATVNISGTSTYKFRNTSSSGAYLRYSSSQLFCAGTNSSNSSMTLYRRTSAGNGSEVVFTLSPASNTVKLGKTLALNSAVTVAGKTADTYTINWVSSNPNVATVSNGVVTAVASGNTTITATVTAANCKALVNNIVLNVPITVEGHTYNAVVTAPTCTEKGYTTYTCVSCGDSYIDDEVAALGHKYEATTVAPTCTSDGSITYTCSCGDTYSEVIEATGHNYNAIVTAPTCTAAGYTTHTCSNCGDSYVSNEVSSLGHSYKAVITAPTCTESGFTTYTCACGDSYVADFVPAKGHIYTAKTTNPTCEVDGSTVYTCSCGDSYIEVIPALGHKYESVVTAPTCTENGYTTYTCHCGNTYVADQVAALGHSYKSVITAPTCIEAGFTTYTCACGDTYIADEVAALGHDIESVVTEATCTTAGFTTNTCRTCGVVTVKDHVDALGHNGETIIVEPTCTTDGYKSENCTRCGESSTQILPALGHKYDAVITEPTCTTTGYTTYTCACGDSYVADQVAALDHTYKSVTVAATCTNDGYITYTCTCGDTYTETIAATGHNYNAVVTEPTCTTVGYTTYTCINCGDSIVSDEVIALGHNYNAEVTAPTCTDTGFTTYTCTCGDSYVADEIAALGHSYTSKTTEATCENNGSVIYTCSCGDSYTEMIPALGHKYESVVTAPTCTEAGFTTYTCVCGDSYEGDMVDALGHSYNVINQNGDLIYTCEHCGDSYIEGITWTPLTNIFKLDTDGIDVGADYSYIIVGSEKDIALKLTNTTIGSAAVKIDDQTIIMDQTEALEFYFKDNNSKEKNTYLITQDGAKGIYHLNGKMYYGNSSRGYWYISSNNNGEYRIYDFDNLNWYLNYGYVWAKDTVNRFAVSSNVRNVRLYQKAELYARLTGAVNQNVTDADNASLASVLDQISIQFSENGSDVTNTIAVTESMLVWDEIFDATTPGVYTATVNYHGTEIGNITVTVASEHNYVTEVIAPTCTEGGYTVRTCTDCDVRYVSDYIDALGHDYSCFESANNKVYTCNNCGDSYEELRYDVLSANFTASSTKTYATTTLIIKTTENVESVTVSNVAGKVENITVKSVETVDGVKTWTVTFRISTIGNRTFTVAGYAANGETGATAQAKIKVTR